MSSKQCCETMRVESWDQSIEAMRRISVKYWFSLISLEESNYTKQGIEYYESAQRISMFTTTDIFC